MSSASHTSNKCEKFKEQLSSSNSGKRDEIMSSVPVDSTESFVTSMREESTSACSCKTKPCSCGRMSGVNHPLGFILPVSVMTARAAAALSSPPDLASYLLGIQALSQARYNNNNNNNLFNNNNNNNSNIDNNHNTNNCNSNLDPPKRVTTSPQVSSSNQTLGADRRRKRRGGLVSRPPFSKSDKSSSNPDKYSEEKKYRCEYCGDCFGYKHVLQNHVRTHTGEKPFQCKEPDCGKRFTRDHHLKTHMRLHTGEKPFKCDYCDKKFVQVANLRRHMRVHTGERPYQCDFASCQAKFSDSNQLAAHRNTHEDQTTIVMTKDEVKEEVKPIPIPIPIHGSIFPFYQYNTILPDNNDVQQEPEDLSLKKSRLVS